MDLSQLNKTKFIPLHLLFWVVVWFFFVYFFSYNSNNANYVTWFSALLLPVTMTTTYFVVYYLIPKYLLTKRYGYFILYSIYTLVFSTDFIILAILGSFVFLSDMEFQKMPPMSRNYVFVLILVYLVVGIVSFVYLLNHNFKTQTKNKELQNKILETQLQIKNQELNYLKKQIHPHFLFNTLNTIYGFALKQSKNTPDIILKLSNLLDYILYQVNKPAVSLIDEVEHIKEYIDLEKMRFQDTLKVNFSAGDIPDNVQIVPMLLIPFVENAFKHGNLIDGYLSVDINLRLINDQLEFTIRNTVFTDEQDPEKEGIGLGNIKKRLDLQYPGRYLLEINNKDNEYSVKLIITDFNIFENA
jgi:sensor histidine kinase YesM